MKTRYLLLGLLAAMLSFGAVAGDKVYKWKDASGVTHFTDTPPPKGTQFDDLKLKGGTSTATTDANAKQDDTATKGDTTAKAPSTGPDSAQCKTSKSRLALLESKAEINTTQDGKAVPMDKSMREAEINVARSQVQSYCGEAASSAQ